MGKSNFLDSRGETDTHVPVRYYISITVALIFICYATSGYTGEKANFITLGLCIFWSVVSFCASPKTFISVFLRMKSVNYLLFILFYLVTSLYTAGVYDTVKYIGTFIILFSPMFMYSYYETLGNIIIIKKLVYSVYAIWFVYALRALYFFTLNPGAARRLVSNSQAFGDIAIGGGYPLAIGSAVLAVFILDLTKNLKTRKKKIVLLSSLAFTILFLVVSETRSTITFLGLIFGLLVSIVLNLFGNKNGKLRINYKSIFSVLLIMITIIVVLININSIGQFIMKQTIGSDNALFKRLYEVGLELAFSGTKEGGSNYLWNRLTLLSDSLEHFASSPFIGNGYKYGYDFHSSKVFGIGNHSEWFDILAVYGLFGGLPFYLIYYFAIKEIRKYNDRTTMLSYIFVIIFLGLFNPFKSFQAHLIIFFVIPSTCIILKNIDGKEV